MRKLILWTSISVDGYFEGPNREIDWSQVDDEFHTYVNGVLKDAGAFLSGRVTYDLMVGFWPTADEDPSNPEPVLKFAAIWRDMPKIVYSKTMQRADWNTTIVREIVPDEVSDLKGQAGGDLILSGGVVASVFAEHDLIDEYWIYVHPVILGGGAPLLTRAYGAHLLNLLDTRVFGNGVVLLKYARDRGVSPDGGNTTGL